jgi:hypothetical protein
MTDEFIIQVIAKRMDEECGFDKVAQVLNHQSWVDVVTHLITEKNLRAALLQAYQPELVKAHATWLLENRESESDGMPL